jgi:hypothetical protein
MFNGLFFASSVRLQVGSGMIDQVSNARLAQALFEIFTNYNEYKDDFYNGQNYEFYLDAGSFCDTDALKKDSESVGFGPGTSEYDSTDKIHHGSHTINVDGTTYDAFDVMCKDSLGLVNKESAVFMDRFGTGSGEERLIQWLVDTEANNLYTFPFGGFIGNGLSHLISAGVKTVAQFGILLMTSMRVVDLLSALIMMWFYAQAYVSEMQSNAIAKFIQRVTSIWITQFYTIAMYGLYISNVNNSSNTSLINLAVNLALVSMMLKPPAALQDILSPSGAANTALGVAQKARGLLS